MRANPFPPQMVRYRSRCYVAIIYDQPLATRDHAAAQSRKENAGGPRPR